MDENLVSYCGLYCGACRAYLKGKCPGCRENEKATWCTIRQCCQKNSYSTCAGCKKLANGVNECKGFNSPMAKLIGFVLRSDRKAGIAMIKNQGLDTFARYMAENRLQSIKRK